MAEERSIDAPIATPEVWSALVAVFSREQSYWLPDRELLSMLFALG